MKASVWLAPSWQRVFPLDPPQTRRRLQLAAARGERISFQVAVRQEEFELADAAVEVRGPDSLPVLVRRVGCVPMPHFNTGILPSENDVLGKVPGYVPDPLYPGNSAAVYRGETQAFWVTVDVPRDRRPGSQTLHVELSLNKKRITPLTVSIEIARVALDPLDNFPVSHFIYADAFCSWYKVAPFGEDFWRIFENYLPNYVSHGNSVLYCPHFIPPLEGIRGPAQLVKIRRGPGGRYEFDWSDVRHWIKLASKYGVKQFEWAHLFTQWGCKYAARICEGNPEEEKLLWPLETGATSLVYRDFLGQFLPAFHRFLSAEGVLESSYFHLSDEPHGTDEHVKNYREAREMVREIAPWMKVMEAISDIRFARENLVDVPVPIIDSARKFVDVGIPCWTYYCCVPVGGFPNRHLDTPLAKLRTSAWLLHRFRIKGFLHWGYNFWFKQRTRQLIDPFFVTDGLAAPEWKYGDTSVVYPGADERPIDSIRWEVFAESLQDLALLRARDVSPESKMLAPFRDFDDFPKDAAWLARTRQKLLFPEKGEVRLSAI